MTFRPVQVSPAAAGDILTAVAYPDPDFEPNALTKWMISELKGIIAANPGSNITSRLEDLLTGARSFPGWQVLPPYLIRVATRHGAPFPMPLGTARSILAEPGVTCWWRPHPALVGYDLLVMRPADGLADQEQAGLFFQVTIPDGTWDQGGEPR